MINIGIVVGSTRPGRNAEAVARWVYENLKERKDIHVEIVDIKDYNLPLLDEPVPPLYHQYSQDHTKKWAQTISRFDGYIFVTPEYNHGIPGALKNALDYLFAEWNHKAAGIVSYGSVGGARAAENLRLILGELLVADVRTAVHLSLFTDFENFSIFKPADHHKDTLSTMVDQLVLWAGALKNIRKK
ncbi:MAG: NAD(P)H-dependent oxidoreductase [Treponemataceae bacterium]|nr:NAD(P)H-dependent oxidoreductase [Treponemataceae bacterium]